MTPKLPDDLAKAVGQRPNEPLRTESETGGVFYIMTDQNLRHIIDDNTRAALREGLEAIDAGQTEEWDVEEFKRRAHKRLANKD